MRWWGMPVICLLFSFFFFYQGTISISYWLLGRMDQHHVFVFLVLFPVLFWCLTLLLFQISSCPCVFSFYCDCPPFMFYLRLIILTSLICVLPVFSASWSSSFVASILPFLPVIALLGLVQTYKGILQFNFFSNNTLFTWKKCKTLAVIQVVI